MGLFDWENIAQNEPVTERVKDRVERINQSSALASDETHVKVTARRREASLKAAKDNVVKYVPIVNRVRPVGETKIMGEVEQAYPNSLVSSPMEGAASIVDKKLQNLLSALAHGRRGRAQIAEFPVDQNIDEARIAALRRKARIALFKDGVDARRLKKIKSKDFRRRKRHAEEKERQKILARLEEEDPVAAANLRAEYEVQRAKDRMQKENKARSKWAKSITRFGGAEVQRAVSRSYQEANERKEFLDKLSGHKSALAAGDEDSTSSEDSSDEGEEVDGKSDEPAKGIMAMKFMQRGRELRMLEALQEAEEEAQEEEELKERSTPQGKRPKVEAPEKNEESVNLPTIEGPTVVLPGEEATELSLADEGEDMSQDALVRMAFNISDETDEREFKERLLAEAEADRRKRDGDINEQLLPGWGSWTGEGVIDHRFERKRKLALEQDEKAADHLKKELSTKRPRVKINDEVIKESVSRYAVDKPDRLLETKNYNALIRQPIGREFTDQLSFATAISPKIMNVGGKVIQALQYQPRAPKLRSL